VAGTVEVLQGKVAWKDVGVSGDKIAVFPELVVAHEAVGTDGTYRFELPAGSYVLRADFSPPSDVQRWVAVEVKAQRSVRQDIPNMCI
jgi:hypothetical protein